MCVVERIGPMGECVAVVVVPQQGWSRGVGKTAVPNEKVWRGVTFFFFSRKVVVKVKGGRSCLHVMYVPVHVQNNLNTRK